MTWLGQTSQKPKKAKISLTEKNEQPHSNTGKTSKGVTFVLENIRNRRQKGEDKNWNNDNWAFSHINIRPQDTHEGSSETTL